MSKICFFGGGGGGCHKIFGFCNVFPLVQVCKQALHLAEQFDLVLFGVHAIEIGFLWSASWSTPLIHVIYTIVHNYFWKVWYCIVYFECFALFWSQIISLWLFSYNCVFYFPSFCCCSFIINVTMPALNWNHICLFSIILWPLYGVTMFLYLFVLTQLCISCFQSVLVFIGSRVGQNPSQLQPAWTLYVRAVSCVRACVFHKSQHQSKFLYFVFYFLLSFRTKTYWTASWNFSKGVDKSDVQHN